MNVVIYTRYSCSRQNETSTQAQLKECYAFCKRNNYTVIKEYIDEVVSGKTDHRINFQKMIADSSKKNFEGIVVYQLDRFARNRYDSATYKAKLKKNGVKVYSAKENITDDASGILIESVLEGMAEYYSAELSQKVKRNLELNAEKGLFNGGYPPLGYKSVAVDYNTYKKKKLVIDSDTAPIVKEIFELRANGTKILDIVDYLNSKGYKTIQGNEFKKTSLQQILKNKRYIGTNIYSNMEFPNTIPAIISEDLFYKVQDIIDKYKYAPAIAKAKEEYILTTKLYCGNCEEMMTGTCGTSQSHNTYYYYICNGVKKHKCKRKAIQKHYIEDIIVQKCKEILTTKNINIIAKEVYEVCQKENAQSCLIKSLEKDIKSFNRNIDNIIKAIETGENIDIFNKKLSENRKKLEKVEEQLENEKKKLINLTQEQIKFFLTQFKKGRTDDLKYRRTLVNIFVNRIYLYEDKLTIIFNVGSRPVTLTNLLIEEITTNLKEENEKEQYYPFVGGFAVSVNYK